MSINNEREIFRQLVESQDKGSSVPASRQQVATAHSLSVADVMALEGRGIAEKWPPLDATVAPPKLNP